MKEVDVFDNWKDFKYITVVNASGEVEIEETNSFNLIKLLSGNRVWLIFKDGGELVLKYSGLGLSNNV